MNSTNERVQLPPQEYPPPVPLLHRPVLHVVVLWIFILAAVAMTQTPQFRKRQAAPQDLTQDLRLQLMGRYIVGMKALLGKAPAFERGIQPLRQSLQIFKGPEKNMFIVPILVELSGKDTALLELERLAASPANAAIDAALFLQLYRDGANSLAPRQRQSIERYGWIGQLALSQELPPSDPARRAILRSAMRTVVVVATFMIGILAAMGAGFIVLAAAVVCLARGRLRRRLLIPADSGTSLLEAFTIYLTGFIALPALVRWLFPNLRFAATVAAILAVIVAGFWPHIRGLDWKHLRVALGWHRGEGFFREIGAGILGYIAGLPVLLGATILVWIISRYCGEIPSHPIMREIGRSPLSMLVWAALACIWAPIVEETFFRGVLYGYFRRRMHWSISGVLTGILFAIVHPQGWIAAPLLAAIGFNLSAIREWRGSIIASMAAHAMNNGAVILLIILAFA